MSKNIRLRLAGSYLRIDNVCMGVILCRRCRVHFRISESQGISLLLISELY
jgi:hypothetical protein